VGVAGAYARLIAGDLIRLLLVDDHAMVRAGLIRLLEGYADIELLGAVADGSEAVSACERGAPDVILMDLEMPVMDGIEATRRILTGRPQTRIVVLTSFADRERILSAVDAGACGYLLKDAEPDELVRGIRAAATREAAPAPRVAAQFGEATAPTETGR
jgi:DNA-binding NarL/FixJ family response regulator